MTTWLITLGMFAILVALALRIFMMMRAGDVTGPAGSKMYGRQLVRAYEQSFPRSRLPVLTLLIFLLGAASLLTGIWRQIRS